MSLSLDLGSSQVRQTQIKHSMCHTVICAMSLERACSFKVILKGTREEEEGGATGMTWEESPRHKQAERFAHETGHCRWHRCQ